MQYVRCESCGAKAILAASRCPKCTHPLELRDHHGEFVPLAHCRKCDTWYPRTRGGCKWCGTKASEPRSASLLVGGGVVAAALVAGLLLWRSRSSAEGPELPPTPVAVTPPAPALPEPTTLTTADTASRIDTMGVLATTPEAITPPLRPTPEVATPAPPPAPSAAREGGRTDTVTFVRFARARVIEYVNVRSEPSPNGRVLAVLTPGVRVEFGGRQSGWRLVRAEGVTGWADPRNFRVDGEPPR